MKTILLGTIGLVALTMWAPASAADLRAQPYVKAPPPPVIAPIYDWSGFYVGVNGGGGSAHTCWNFIEPATGVPVDEGCHDATGGTAGGQIGYRWQAVNWVFGIEGQGNWADFSGSNRSLLFTSETDRTKLDAFGLITGQVGYAWSNVLFYVKGGAAVAGDKYDNFKTATDLPVTAGNETRWGGTIGAGLEFGFAPNWALGLEYDHLFLGSRDVLLTGLFVDTIRIHQDVDMGLVRLNYRFGGFGGPLAARY